MGAGRPRIILDEQQLFKLRQYAAAGCTNDEIAIMLGVSRSTLQRNYDTDIKEGRAGLCVSLRAMQVKTAMGGNPTMQIWLGKQMLGQKDHVDVDLAATVKPIGWDNLYEEEQDLPDLVGDALEASDMILEEGEE